MGKQKKQGIYRILIHQDTGEFSDIPRLCGEEISTNPFSPCGSDGASAPRSPPTSTVRLITDDSRSQN